MNEGRHLTNSKSAPNVIRLAVVMCIGVMCYVICSSLDVFFVPTVAIRPNSSSDGVEPNPVIATLRCVRTQKVNRSSCVLSDAAVRQKNRPLVKSAAKISQTLSEAFSASIRKDGTKPQTRPSLFKALF